MKYMAILFSLLFALSNPTLADQSAASDDQPTVPELVDTAGVITEITEDQIMLDTATHGPVLVHLTDDTIWEGETPAVGAYVHVINNGAMTMSLPPQITALRVGCYAFTGTVSDITDESFMLTGDGSVYQVNAEADQLAELTDGQEVTVYSNGAMTMSIPAQIYGEMIVPAN